MTRIGPPVPSFGGGGGGAAIVNDHVRPVLSSLPAASLIEPSATTVAVYTLDASRSELGFRIARRVGASYVTLAGTRWSAASLSVTLEPLTPVTASLNVALTLAFAATPVALAAGAT